MRAFVDTSALYALLDRDDDNHIAAVDTWRELLTGEATLWVTNYVLVETSALVQRRLGMNALRAFVSDLEPVLSTHWVSNDDHRSAREAVVTANRRHLSLVDCASFHVMRTLGLRTAFAFNRHFAEQGFEVRPHQPG